MDCTSHNARIKAAIADLKCQERVNYAATARKWDLEPTTLRRHFIGELTSNEEANFKLRLTSVYLGTIDHKRKIADDWWLISSYCHR
jgi:transposase-like protein